MGTANSILECCQDIFEGAKATATELEAGEDSDKDMYGDIVGSVVMWDPDWSDERKAAAEAFWPNQPPRAVLDEIAKAEEQMERKQEERGPSYQLSKPEP